MQRIDSSHFSRRSARVTLTHFTGTLLLFEGSVMYYTYSVDVIKSIVYTCAYASRLYQQSAITNLSTTLLFYLFVGFFYKYFAIMQGYTYS